MEKEPPDGLRRIHRRRHGRAIQIEIPDLSTGFGKIFNFSGRLACGLRREAQERYIYIYIYIYSGSARLSGRCRKSLRTFQHCSLRLVRLACHRADKCDSRIGDFPSIRIAVMSP